MSLLTPKTIVITAYPGKHGSITVPSSRNDEYSLLDAADSFDMDTGGTKKRRRLTHLSPDEKLLRRKLKNRVAAQTARDRKKALMGELEERVAQLEEENKLLRRQNNSLKETSTTLSQENAALKSRLSEGSLTSVKTESSTISTRCSSAEGAGAGFVSVDGSVRRLCSDSQPDDFLCLLQELVGDEQSSGQSQAETAAPVSPSVNRGDKQSGGSVRSASGMVGLTPAELESLNELIQIDHVYVKPQPSEEKVQASKDRAQLLPAGSKRPHSSSTVSPEEISLGLNTSFDIEQEQGTPSFLFSPASDSTQAADDLLSSLSDSEMESSLNFFEHFDLEDVIQNCDKTSWRVNSNDASFLDASLSKTMPTEKLQDCSNETEQHCIGQLFDEICEHHLSVKDSLSTDSGNVSDSGFSSDLEGSLSPQSSSHISLLDDDGWQDPYNLFPDLQ